MGLWLPQQLLPSRVSLGSPCWPLPLLDSGPPVQTRRLEVVAPRPDTKVRGCGPQPVMTIRAEECSRRECRVATKTPFFEAVLSVVGAESRSLAAPSGCRWTSSLWYLCSSHQSSAHLTGGTPSTETPCSTKTLACTLFCSLTSHVPLIFMFRGS